jgi:hypothetical protein
MLLGGYPEIADVLPILLALREKSVKVLDHLKIMFSTTRNIRLANSREYGKTFAEAFNRSSSRIRRKP